MVKVAKKKRYDRAYIAYEKLLTAEITKTEAIGRLARAGFTLKKGKHSYWYGYDK